MRLQSEVKRTRSAVHSNRVPDSRTSTPSTSTESGAAASSATPREVEAS